jgi:hypothetical protein
LFFGVRIDGKFTGFDTVNSFPPVVVDFVGGMAVNTFKDVSLDALTFWEVRYGRGARM